MFEANQIVAGALDLLRQRLRPGMTTYKLDRLAEEFCREHHAVPAFKGYRGFPASLCISINEQVVHGIPSKKVFVREGDIVSMDFGVKYKGFFGDSALTLAVGKVSAEKEKLMRVTRESLDLAIEQVRIGNRIADLSRAIQSHVEKHGFSVVRQFVGHGVGRVCTKVRKSPIMCKSIRPRRESSREWSWPSNRWSMPGPIRSKSCMITGQW